MSQAAHLEGVVLLLGQVVFPKYQGLGKADSSRRERLLYPFAHVAAERVDEVAHARCASNPLQAQYGTARHFAGTRRERNRVHQVMIAEKPNHAELGVDLDHVPSPQVLRATVQTHQKRTRGDGAFAVRAQDLGTEAQSALAPRRAFHDVCTYRTARGGAKQRRYLRTSP